MTAWPTQLKEGKCFFAARLLRNYPANKNTLSIFIATGLDIDFVMLISQIQSQYLLESKQQRYMNITIR